MSELQTVFNTIFSNVPKFRMLPKNASHEEWIEYWEYKRLTCQSQIRYFENIIRKCNSEIEKRQSELAELPAFIENPVKGIEEERKRQRERLQKKNSQRRAPAPAKAPAKAQAPKPKQTPAKAPKPAPEPKPDRAPSAE